MTLKQFQAKCMAADKEVMFIDDTSDACEFEDDGYLHIVRNKWRAVFDVSNAQNSSGKEQNIQTCKILDALGIKPKDMSRVLTDDTDEDEE